MNYLLVNPEIEDMVTEMRRIIETQEKEIKRHEKRQKKVHNVSVTSSNLIDQLNSVIDENTKIKVENSELKSENQYLQNAKREQCEALVMAAREIKLLKDEVRAQKELFDTAVKDQVVLHDSNVQLRLMIKKVEQRERDRENSDRKYERLKDPNIELLEKNAQIEKLMYKMRAQMTDKDR